MLLFQSLLPNAVAEFLEHSLTKLPRRSQMNKLRPYFEQQQIQIFANWPMSHAKRVTRDNRKNPEYHVIAVIRKLRTD